MSDHTRPPQPDPELSSLLREWRVSGEFSSGMEGRVWRRIEAAAGSGRKAGAPVGAPPKVSLGEWVRGLLLGGIGDWRGGGVRVPWAYALLPLLAATGLGSLWGAQQARREAPERYVVSLHSVMTQSLAAASASPGPRHSSLPQQRSTGSTGSTNPAAAGEKTDKFGDIHLPDTAPNPRNP